MRTIVLEGERWVVGRADDCDIRLVDPTASRHHLVIERREDGLYFRDLGGVNATLLNGRQAREAKLQVGSTLTVGMTRLTLDTLRAQTKVKIDPENHLTRVVQRSYMEGGPTDTPTPFPASGGLQVTAADPRRLASLFETLATPYSDLGSAEEIAGAMLDLALDQTMRQRGLIGTFDVVGQLTVLASADRTNSEGDLHLPAELVESARARREPFLSTTMENGSPTPEQLFAPLGGIPGGLLMLDTELPNAPRSQDALKIAAALGKLIWRRLDEAEERYRLRTEVQRLRSQRNPVQTFLLAGARLAGVAQRLRSAARHGLPVHLRGEEGTELEMLARHLHASTPNQVGPFVTFQAGLVPPSRVEEHLLGAGLEGQDGSMLGGAFVRAHGGLLFLENPELLPERVQDRLAVVLSRGLESAGSSQRAIPVDVRVVSAAQEIFGSDPATTSEAGFRLRPALAELLLSICIDVPPLRSEPAEIAPLAELILTEMGPAPDGAPRSLTDSARRMLVEHPWPGNLRQLRRSLEFAAARAGNQPIAPRFLPPEIQSKRGLNPRLFPSLAEIEKQHIIKVVEASGGNRREAANRLGIAISTLYDKMRKFESGG